VFFACNECLTRSVYLSYRFYPKLLNKFWLNIMFRKIHYTLAGVRLAGFILVQYKLYCILSSNQTLIFWKDGSWYKTLTHDRECTAWLHLQLSFEKFSRWVEYLKKYKKTVYDYAVWHLSNTWCTPLLSCVAAEKHKNIYNVLLLEEEYTDKQASRVCSIGEVLQGHLMHASKVPAAVGWLVW
jgi:hypothetical protein